MMFCEICALMRFDPMFVTKKKSKEINDENLTKDARLDA